MRRRAWRWALGLVLVPLALWGWLSIDRCGDWPMKGPALTVVSQSTGVVKAGAGRAPLNVRWPAVSGGYGPPRASVDKALTPLQARAVVIEVNNQSLALVLLDVLLVPPQLRDAIAANQRGPTWVLATHTHSGPGGYDPRAASEWAALGSFAQADQDVLVQAAKEALEQAQRSLTEVKVEVGERRDNALSVPRSGAAADQRVTRVRFDGANGPVAQLVIASGHPTLAPRRPEGLHADWPGLLADRLEANGGPVTLVLQGSGGNASIDRDAAPTPEAAAEKLEQLVRALPTAEQPGPVIAAWNEVKVSLPRPQATRLVPGPLTAIVENALCDHAEDLVLLHGLRLGELRLLFVPFEPSLAAGLVLEEQARAQRLVSLGDGYAGYVETVEVARTGGGESTRQYFPADLLTGLADGARLVGDGLTSK